MTISAGESKFLWAERQQESGGNYGASNSIGAMGAYQVLSSNLIPWETEAGLPIETGTKFLQDKTEQDNLAIYKLGGYYNKYGDKGAAAMWYSGQSDPNKTFGNPPVYQYVSEVVAKESQAPVGGIGVGSTPSSTATQTSAVPGVPDPVKALLSVFGITDFKDAMERLGLILIGALFIIVAVVRFTDVGSAAASKVKTAVKAAV